MIRVLLADDEAMIRVGVRAILATDPVLEVVTASSCIRRSERLSERRSGEGL